jgi:phage recombination protein Bet
MTALALRDDQTYWDDKQIAVLQAGGIDEDVTEAELMAFLHECQRRKLDPFSRQIYLIGRKDKSKGRKVYRSQTSIDGFRLIARRAADKSGIDYSYEDTIWYGADGSRHEIWLADRPPSGAKVVVIRGGARFDAVARYGAYVQTDWDGNPLKQWRTMPDVMIAKCAEALALRKAFPEDLGGIYTEDEMGQADNPQRVTATAEVIREDRRNGGNGQAAEDAWENATPAPPRQGRQRDPTSPQAATSANPATSKSAQPATPASSGPERPWADTAIEQAASFKTEAEGTRLWKEAAARHLGGECTRDEQDHIQRLVEARIHDRRREAATRILRPLAEGDPWRDKILDELASDDDARGTLGDLQDQISSGSLDEDRARLLGRAVVARFPKAALKAGEDDG